MATCKYCKIDDQKSQMHKDKLTKEYYHELCRPKLRKKNGLIHEVSTRYQFSSYRQYVLALRKWRVWNRERIKEMVKRIPNF